MFIPALTKSMPKLVFDKKLVLLNTYNLDYGRPNKFRGCCCCEIRWFSKQLRTGILSDVSKSVQYKYGTNEGEFERWPR